MYPHPIYSIISTTRLICDFIIPGADEVVKIERDFFFLLTSWECLLLPPWGKLNDWYRLLILAFAISYSLDIWDQKARGYHCASSCQKNVCVSHTCNILSCLQDLSIGIKMATNAKWEKGRKQQTKNSRERDFWPLTLRISLIFLHGSLFE